MSDSIIENETAEAVDSEEIEEVSFEDLGLDEQTLAAVEKKGFKVPSPIQVLAIPRLLNGDTNLIAKARTGTGKTAAFGLPIVQNIKERGDNVRALILEPTRELAIQTCEELKSFTDEKNGPRITVLYGGASYSNQIKDLKRGCEIVAGTPGRIKDHLERGTLNLDKIEFFILDEGDEMLDMGFVDDIKEIFGKANPDSRILLFSATMPKPILQIAEEFMGEYDIVEEEGFIEEPLLIDQKYWIVSERDKIEALVRLVDQAPDFYGLVFTMTKNDADMVSRILDEKGYEAGALHGDIPQGQREKILARFRSRKTRILVATDVAARGIDISGLSHVVNYSLPFDAATYVHRIGRTGRAGTTGTAVTFVRPDERRKLEFLRAKVRKAAKGEMQEEAVPSVEKVLETKKERMLDTLKIKIGLKREQFAEADENKAKFDSEEVVPMEGESAGTEENGASAEKNSFEPVLMAAREQYVKMAEGLCEGQDPKAVLAAILEVTYGKSLDRSHYGKITEFKGFSKNNQKRIYIQLGRKDGYNPRSLAEYFSSMLNIPGRLVDRIDIADKFSLVSLPAANAEHALALAKSGKAPHMHVDVKEDFGGEGRGRGGKGRGAGRGFGRDGGRGAGGERGERRFGGRDRGDRRERGERGERGRKDNARPRVHTATQRTGASAYKKSNRKAEQF